MPAGRWAGQVRPCRGSARWLSCSKGTFASRAILPEPIDVVPQVAPVDLLCRVEAVDVLLDVRVTVAAQVLRGIRRVVGVQAVTGLPFVRDAIAVGIHMRRALVLGIT